MSDVDIRRIRIEAENIIALASGPWSKGENLPLRLREPMRIRSAWYRTHAESILRAIGDPVERRR